MYSGHSIYEDVKFHCYTGPEKYFLTALNHPPYQNRKPNSLMLLAELQINLTFHIVE